MVFLLQVGNKIWVSINVIKKLMHSKANPWFLHLVSEVTIKGTCRQLFRVGWAWKVVNTLDITPLQNRAVAQRGFSKGKTVPGKKKIKKKIKTTTTPTKTKFQIPRLSIFLKRFQKFKSGIPISLLPLGCSVIEWKSYDLSGQCDSRRRTYIDFYL